MKVSVVIPTTKYRKDYLERCVAGYKRRTPDEVEIIVEEDAISCGAGWQAGAEKATGDYIHLTCDDIVPDYGWLTPCVEAVRDNYVPVVKVGWGPKDLDANLMPKFGCRAFHWSFFEDHKDYPDWHKASTSAADYPSLPFCSIEQWKDIGPMIPCHYATDKWFGHRAKKFAYWPVVRTEARFFHYAATSGRDQMIDGWTGLDRLTFDQNIAFPDYVSGKLSPYEYHPEAFTIKGRDMARNWYTRNVEMPERGWPWTQFQYDKEGNTIENSNNG